MSTMTQSEAFEVIRKARDEGQLMVLVMGRGDFDTRAGSDLTDEEWLQVVSSKAFRDGFTDEAIMDDAWSAVDAALEAAGIEPDPDGDG